MGDISVIFPTWLSRNTDAGIITTQPSGGSYSPGANVAVYMPFNVTSTTTIKRLWFIGDNGTGNVDVGVYAADGTKMVTTGAVANAAGIVVTDVGDTALVAGQYYLAISASSGSSNLRVSVTTGLDSLGLLTEASAHVLPASATLTTKQTSPFLPLFGFLTTAADL